MLSVSLSTQLKAGKWVALDEGGWFLYQRQGGKSECLSGVSSPGYCLGGFHRWEKPLLGEGFIYIGHDLGKGAHCAREQLARGVWPEVCVLILRWWFYFFFFSLFW